MTGAGGGGVGQHETLLDVTSSLTTSLAERVPHHSH